MSPRRRLAYSLTALLGVLIIGTIGFLAIAPTKDRSVLDAVYMTVITLSTVGYREVWEPTDSGKLWTITVITIGIGTVSVAFTSLIALFVSGELRSLRESKRMEAELQRMRNHVVLCGMGRMGGLIAAELTERGVPVAIIEVSPDREPDLRDLGVPYLIADATEDETLLKSGLMNARALITALPHDADNVYITLTTRSLRPDITIVARAEQPSAEPKLKRAGASRVICPQIIGATRIANVITRPNVVDFVDIANKGVDLEMDEYELTEGSPIVGLSLRDSALRTKIGAMVIAVKRADGSTLFNPDPDAVLAANDTLILIGEAGISERLGAI